MVRVFRPYGSLGLAVGGCAGAEAARYVSRTAAELTDSYKTQTQKLFDAQNSIGPGDLTKNRIAKAEGGRA